MSSQEQIQRVARIIEMQLEALRALNQDLSITIPAWRDRTIRFLSRDLAKDEVAVLAGISTSSWEKDKKLLEDFLLTLKKGIMDAPDLYLIGVVDDRSVAPTPANQSLSSAQSEPDTGGAKRVFVVHGHDSLAKVEVARLIETLGLEAVVLHEQPNEGRTIIEKFERNAAGVGFAVVVLTPDDIGYPANKPSDQKSRARQNVVLELGFFCGALGRSKVCVLYKGDVEIPSDYLGVVYTPLDVSGAWRFALAREMKAGGMKVDLNKLA